MNPSLFGIQYSNRDFSQKDTWWKNQFNSSFPASLCVYLYSKWVENIYITLDSTLKVNHGFISTKDFFWIDPKEDDIFYSFESQYSPYQQLLVGYLPRVDLVIQSRLSWQAITPIEIKLTALPDNSTCELSNWQFWSELVVRPDTIVYLACSIVEEYKHDYIQFQEYFSNDFDLIRNWWDWTEIWWYIPKMISIIDAIMLDNITKQKPLVMQPIWKTEWKSSKLADNCLDIFVWSNYAFTQLFIDVARWELRTNVIITRQIRTIIWLFKMLYDFSKNGQINHEKIIDELSYNTKNDKAFAASWRVTHKYMHSDSLTKPRITKDAIKEIILGWGQFLLSPERRFDAIIYSSSDLFE